jgi:SAM-dependent methyltransferase
MKVRRPPRTTARTHPNLFPPADERPTPPSPDATPPTDTETRSLRAIDIVFVTPRPLTPVPSPLRPSQVCAATAGVNHEAGTIVFDHPALGDTPVSVRQNLDPLGDGRDATARWVWDAAAPMAQYLADNPDVIRGKTVVELGCGPALPGIVAARLGAKRVVLTDLPGELDLPRINADANGARDVAECAPCAWGDAAHADALGTFDVVLCSDVLYGHRADVARALATTMRALCRDPGGDDADAAGGSTALVAYYPREKLEADRPFFDATETLFEDPTPREVGGVAEGDEDLWFFEYRPK